MDEAFARFVLGQWELTPEGIQEFRQGLKDHGADRMIDFWQGMAAVWTAPALP